MKILFSLVPQLLPLPFRWFWHHSYQIKWLPWSFREYISECPLFMHMWFLLPRVLFKFFCQSWIHLWNPSDKAFLSWSLHLSLQQTGVSGCEFWKQFKCSFLCVIKGYIKKRKKERKKNIAFFQCLLMPLSHF